MKTQAHGSSGSIKMPSTQVFSLFDEQLIVCLRSWNGTEICQKILDEISHFMSSVDADLEMTSPFEYSEGLSTFANKLKISVLMANDLILGSDNKSSYQHGAEILLLFKKNLEICWASVGRFSVDAVKNDVRLKIFDGGRPFDDEVLLPVDLLGLVKIPEVRAGSFSSRQLSRVQISSIYGQTECFWECQITEFS